MANECIHCQEEEALKSKVSQLPDFLKGPSKRQTATGNQVLVSQAFVDAAKQLLDWVKYGEYHDGTHVTCEGCKVVVRATAAFSTGGKNGK